MTKNPNEAIFHNGLVFIKLTQRTGNIKWAIVNKEMYVNVKYHRWYVGGMDTNYYALSSKLVMHKILCPCDKPLEVDHINGNGLDNRLKNLRVATRVQNHFNTRKQRNNISGYKGVYFDKVKNRWRAEINIHRSKIFLGSFPTKEQAYQTYCEAAELYHKDFARF